AAPCSARQWIWGWCAVLLDENLRAERAGRRLDATQRQPAYRREPERNAVDDQRLDRCAVREAVLLRARRGRLRATARDPQRGNRRQGDAQRRLRGDDEQLG